MDVIIVCCVSVHCRQSTQVSRLTVEPRRTTSPRWTSTPTTCSGCTVSRDWVVLNRRPKLPLFVLLLPVSYSCFFITSVYWFLTVFLCLYLPRRLRGVMCPWFVCWFWCYIYRLLVYVICFPIYPFSSLFSLGVIRGNQTWAFLVLLLYFML